MIALTNNYHAWRLTSARDKAHPVLTDIRQRIGMCVCAPDVQKLAKAGLGYVVGLYFPFLHRIQPVPLTIGCLYQLIPLRHSERLRVLIRNT